MPGARKDPKDIVSMLKTLNENIKRKLSPRVPQPMKGQIKIILSLNPKKDGKKIIEMYDDLLDDFISQGIEYPL